ncbi:hypothetical protein CM240_2429 [Clostridium bornimense]|uniref:RNA-binding protein n=1 Tax=Clostridium bornimense TaxID=1216932 RepID=W6RY28_9CLOT|nr:hypothetical protein [Clostridium bornimense]CDM69566.1 hypothetical protein CM240_2429 [Clostridium bornimense]
MEGGNLINRIVIGKAGRDSGKYFLIIGVIDDEYVLICNGKNRSIDKPKKKKIKHLNFTNIYTKDIEPYTNAKIDAFIKSVDIDKEV